MTDFDLAKEKIAQYLKKEIGDDASSYIGAFSAATTLATLRKTHTDITDGKIGLSYEFFPDARVGVEGLLSEYERSLEAKPKRGRKAKAATAALSTEGSDLAAALGAGAPTLRVPSSQTLTSRIQDAGTGGPDDAGTGGGGQIQPSYPGTATGSDIAGRKDPDLESAVLSPAQESLYKLYAMFKGEMPEKAPDHWKNSPVYRRFADGGIMTTTTPDKLEELRYKDLTKAEREDLKVTKTALNDVLVELEDMRKKNTDQRTQFNALYLEAKDYEELLNAALDYTAFKKLGQVWNKIGGAPKSRKESATRNKLTGGVVGLGVGLALCAWYHGCGPGKYTASPKETATPYVSTMKAPEVIAMPSVAAPTMVALTYSAPAVVSQSAKQEQPTVAATKVEVKSTSTPKPAATQKPAVPKNTPVPKATAKVEEDDDDGKKPRKLKDI